MSKDWNNHHRMLAAVSRVSGTPPPPVEQAIIDGLTR